MAFFAQTTASVGKKMVVTLFFYLEKRQYFSRHVAKIAENCYIVDPRDRFTKLNSCQSTTFAKLFSC
jgi:hypothetical protein